MGSSGYIFISLDSGVTWATSTAAGYRSWSSLKYSPDGTKIFATVQNGQAYISSDSGVTWSTRGENKILVFYYIIGGWL